jgi:hypothetical protein
LPEIAALGLPADLAAGIEGAKRVGKSVPATIEVGKKGELVPVLTLLDFKRGAR